MRMLDGKFRIVCDGCNRGNTHWVFTEDGDIVIHCKACGHTEIVFKEVGGI